MTHHPRITPAKALLIGAFVVGTITFGSMVEVALAHISDAEATVLAAPSSLSQVIDNLRNVIMGLLVAIATLFLTVSGLRYMLAGGDPGEIEAAKKTFRYAAIGYGIAVLAPVLVSILKGIVGA